MTRRLFATFVAAAAFAAGFVVWGVHRVDAGRLLQERDAAAVASRSSSSYRVDWRARYRREHRHVQRLLRELRNVRHVQAVEPVPDIIRRVFGAYGDQAVRVSYCETGGTFSTSATNGQYKGIFQMGSSERATYGDASDAEGQARAAYRYFAATGYSWGPWQCKP